MNKRSYIAYCTGAMFEGLRLEQDETVHHVVTSVSISKYSYSSFKDSYNDLHTEMLFKIDNDKNPTWFFFLWKIYYLFLKQ